MGLTSISIDEKVRDRLRSLSQGARNYSETLTRLMDRAEMDDYFDDLRRRADDPDHPWLDKLDWD